MQFYSSQISTRSYFNNVLACGPSTQQYIIDSYVGIEGSLLKFARKNQVEFHVARYVGLTDFINTRAEREENMVGTVCVLPSSFIGSPRAMK